MMRQDVDASVFMPDDYADESSHMAANNYLTHDWVMGPMVHLAIRSNKPELDTRYGRHKPCCQCGKRRKRRKHRGVKSELGP